MKPEMVTDIELRGRRPDGPLHRVRSPAPPDFLEPVPAPVNADAAGEISVTVYRDAAAIPPAAVERWRELEQRALLDNAYLSADFILPALGHLPGRDEPLIVMAERRSGGDTHLIGLGVFQGRRKAGLLPYLVAYKPAYAFQSGLLLDRTHYRAARAAIFSWLKRARRWHAVVFIDRPPLPGDSDLDDQLAAAGIRRVRMHEKIRAGLTPQRCGDAHLKKKLSARTRKGLNRKLRQLERMGRFEWRFVPAADIDGQTLEDFLRLEDAGWKGDIGTSLQSRPETRAFFLDFIGRFRRRGQAFFTELRLGGKVIASTCNISSGATGFAFKLGWDPAYGRQSVGYLNEYLLVREAPVHLSHLRHMDSGAEPGSFLEQLWTDSRVLLTDAYSLNPVAYVYLVLHRVWLAAKRRLLRKSTGPCIEAIVSRRRVVEIKAS